MEAMGQRPPSELPRRSMSKAKSNALSNIDREWRACVLHLHLRLHPRLLRHPCESLQSILG